MCAIKGMYKLESLIHVHTGRAPRSPQPARRNTFFILIFACKRVLERQSIAPRVRYQLIPFADCSQKSNICTDGYIYKV